MSADKEARRLGFETKVLAAFAAAALVVAALAATTWKMSQDAIEGALRLSRTHEVLTGLADAKGYSYLVELSTQNYRVSGDPAHLVERDTAIAARDAALRRIEALTADNPGQQARLKQAGQVIAERLAISRRTELLRRTEGPEAANAYVAGAPLKETRERLFHLLGEMEAEEHRLLAERQALQARRHAMETMAALASALAVLLLAANFVLIRRQMRATEAARNAAELANRAKDSFLATMSHEIRTPLGGPTGHAGAAFAVAARCRPGRRAAIGAGVGTQPVAHSQ